MANEPIQYEGVIWGPPCHCDRWCFSHNERECVHVLEDLPPHCFEVDGKENYSKCDVRDAVVTPKEE